MLGKIDTLEGVDKPVIICGWGKVKKLYPKQKITNKQISDNIFWTFSEKEKRNEHDGDIEKFKKFCISNIESNYKYHFLNPFELSYWTVKKLINRINLIKTDKFYYFDDKHFFISIENYIFGVNIEFLSYTNITPEKLKKWLNFKNFKIIHNSTIFNIEEMNNKKHLTPIFREENYEEQLIIGYIFE